MGPAWVLFPGGLASLVGPAFPAFSWFIGADVQRRGGVFSVVSGALLSGLHFWGSAALHAVNRAPARHRHRPTG